MKWTRMVLSSLRRSTSGRMTRVAGKCDSEDTSIEESVLI